jgi:hypothetical protein
MVLAVTIFADPAVYYLDKAINLVAIVIEAWALIHCVLQRPDAFTALGTLAKGGWLVILALALLITMFFGVLGGAFLLGLIGFGFAGFYLLQVRSGFRELREGRW